MIFTSFKRAGVLAFALTLGLGLGFALGLARPAAAQEPTKSQVDAARSVLILSGMNRSFDVVPQMMDQIARNLLKTRPELGKDLNAVMDQLTPEFEPRREEMLNLAARIFIKKMTQEELTQIAAFFDSPVGRKYVASQPAMLDELVVSMQGFSQKTSTDLFARVREEMKKKGHEL